MWKKRGAASPRVQHNNIVMTLLENYLRSHMGRQRAKWIGWKVSGNDEWQIGSRRGRSEKGKAIFLAPFRAFRPPACISFRILIFIVIETNIFSTHGHKFEASSPPALFPSLALSVAILSLAPHNECPFVAFCSLALFQFKSVHTISLSLPTSSSSYRILLIALAK
jgi:hypothetical protein